MEQAETDRLLVLIERSNRLLAMQLVKGLSLREQVVALDFAGFEPREIAQIVRRTPNHVSVILHEERRRQSKEAEIEQTAQGSNRGDSDKDGGSAANPIQKVLR